LIPLLLRSAGSTNGFSHQEKLDSVRGPLDVLSILVVAIGISQIFMVFRRDVINDWIQKIK
jgi:hypothetical protein